MSGLFTPTFEDMLAEIDRELAMRERVYPKWCASGKMKRETAERQVVRANVTLGDVGAPDQLEEGPLFAVAAE